MNDKTIAELRDFRNDLSGHPCLQMILDGILSRAEQEAKDEPLAVLADRKGCWPQIIRNRTKWVVDIFPIDKETGEDLEGEVPMFYACVPTYSEAESKARAYLAGLPDKEEGK